MRRLLLLGETQIRAHWTVLPALLLLLVAEGPRRVGLGLLALLVHELGHLFTARGLGYRVSAWELWPFGAALETDMDTGGREPLFVALAGPLCGLGAAGMSLLFVRLLPVTAGVMEPFFLQKLRRGRYTLIRVIGRGNRLLGTLDEGALLDGLLRRGTKATLRDLVFLFDR